MEDLAKTIAKRAQEMKQPGDAYFPDWEARTAAIQNPDEKKKAEAHTADRKASTAGFHRKMSVPKAKELFASANWHSLDVQRSLMQMEDEFEKLAAMFGTTKPDQ